ncbi:MAG: hypothetical protein Q8O64_02455 [Sideroxyarcus sp.]|nr:hypothetical protein [Sideroxyarcus sp.]
MDFPEMTPQRPQDALPHDIRLIAAVARLLDVHQSRRVTGGAYVPEVPESAGYNLFVALSIIESLHEIEINRGIGFAPLNELASQVRKRVPSLADADIEDCITNLKTARELHYGVTDDAGDVRFGRTWDSTPLLEVQEGFSQVQLTENARLLLRVAALKESWLYSDLDADRLVKAIERGQFQDVPAFCRAMTLDLSAKSKQLSAALERPSLTELRTMLISDGASIANSLNAAAATVNQAIELVFSNQVRQEWERRPYPGFHLGNLQADLELVLQNVEALSRRFLQFLEMAQRVRNEGNEAIRFLQIADVLVACGDSATIDRTEALLHDLLPWGITAIYFHPSSLVGETDLKMLETKPAATRGYTVNPHATNSGNRFLDFINRNRDAVVSRLQQGPVSFSEMATSTGFVFEGDESPLDFFGIYAAPGSLDSDTQRIVVGLTDAQTCFTHGDRIVAGSDPVMFLEDKHDPY